MKKIITSIALAAALVSCVSDFDNNVTVGDKMITVNVNADSPSVRTELVNNNGEFSAIWKANDAYMVIEVVGSTKGNYFYGTVESDTPTLSATMELAVKEGEEFHYIFASPSISMNNACKFTAYTLSANQAPASMTTFDGKSDFLLSKAINRTSQPSANETLAFEVNRISSIGKVSVKNLALADGDKVTSVDIKFAEPISGKITNVMVADIIAGTYPLTFTHTTPINNVTVTLPEAQTGDFTYYMNCWPQTLDKDSEYTVTVTTEKDQFIKTATLPADLVFSMGDMTSFTVNMEGVVAESAKAPLEPIEGTLLVGDIYWATGNLQYEATGTADEGFATGWRLAPSQEHMYDFDQIGAVEGRSGQRVYTDYSKRDVFNLGGIENPWTYEGNYVISAPVGTDISGKMYTDQTCTTETTDFTAAKYGDIAYWASNGKYRMPTKSEFEQLVSKASSTLAVYNQVYGIYFYNPAEGETVSHSNTTTTLTDEQMASGLFLPCAGRGYNTVTDAVRNPEWNVFKSNDQGIYRSSTLYTYSSATSGVSYGFYIYFQKNSAEWYGTNILTHTNAAFSVNSRYSIRPVYIVPQE